MEWDGMGWDEHFVPVSGHRQGSFPATVLRYAYNIEQDSISYRHTASCPSVHPSVILVQIIIPSGMGFCSQASVAEFFCPGIVK